MDPSDIPLDSSDGLKALCKACMVPEDVTAHLISQASCQWHYLGMQFLTFKKFLILLIH